MDAAPFLVMMTLAAIVFAFVMAANLKTAKQTAQAYGRLAERFGGEFYEGGLFGRPSVRFAHDSASVVIDIHSTGGKHPKYYTQFHVAWPHANFRCEVYPEGVMSRLGKFFGMDDIEIGSPTFDRDYIITGNDVRTLRQFLTPSVQQCIHRLRTTGQDDIYVSTSGGRLLIKKLGYLREYGELSRYASLCLALYDAAVASQGEGIDFVGNKAEATLSLKEAVCQICGELVKLDAVFCRSCKTPHHRDCWEYYGACSTFGCGQRRFVLARRPRVGR